MNDWDDLRFFLAVGETGSLAGAARRLRVNHSTVFRRINAMEEKLQVRLFDRLPEGYRLTPEGESIIDEARRIEESIHEIDRRIAGKDLQLSGLIRLTSPLELALKFLPELLARFAAAYPDIEIEIAVSDSDFDLSRREADLALRATAAPPEHLIGRKIVDLPWFAVAGEAYLEPHGVPADVDALSGHCLIGADAAFSRLTIFEWQRRRFPASIIRYRSNNLATMAALARAGLGIAFLPVDQDQAGLRRLFPVCAEATSGLWLLTHPDLRQTARVRTLMTFLHEELADDPRLLS